MEPEHHSEHEQHSEGSLEDADVFLGMEGQLGEGDLEVADLNGPEDGNEVAVDVAAELLPEAVSESTFSEVVAKRMAGH